MNLGSGTYFDYIIIGAGSAGCVLANRLTDNSKHTVLVLEAGGRDNNLLIHMPYAVGKIWKNPKFNWSYNSEPEPNLGNRVLFHPRGKVLGGSSSINMTAYVRGNSGDYDRWGQTGLIDWSYDKVLPYFKKSENYLAEESSFHGTTGPMKTTISGVEDPVFEAYLASGEALGFRHQPDFNGADQEGLSKMQVNSAEGKRFSAAVSFLHPAISRDNLEVSTRSLVKRLLFDGTKVIGIEYVKSGNIKKVFARKEVILSAGTYNSAKILLLSGIGPEDELRKLGIDIIASRKNVGKNLQDHPSFNIEYKRISSSQFYQNLRLDRLAFNFIRALLFRSGPASHALAFGTGFVRSTPDKSIPDIQLFLKNFSVQDKEWFPMIRSPGPNGLGIMACHLRPESRGSVSLGSAKYQDPPKIINNFLNTENDRTTLRRAFHIVRQIFEQKPFSEHIGMELTPGTNVKSDDEIDKFIRETLITVYHPIGSCRMGIDDEAVVDPELRVRGVQGLRIVDASVMPDLIGGNTNACVLMIAEKAADIIKGHKKPANPYPEQDWDKRQGWEEFVKQKNKVK